MCLHASLMSPSKGTAQITLIHIDIKIHVNFTTGNFPINVQKNGHFME